MIYDVLIIGAGGAGLAAALEASKDPQKKIIVAAKSPLLRAQTVMAQGGINAALSNAQEDSANDHINDTLKGGAGLCILEAVQNMCEHGVKTIQWLDWLGVPFDRNNQGEIDQRPFGGAAHPRTCYSADMTGHALLSTLYDQLILKENVTLLDEVRLLELSANDHEIYGGHFLELRTGKVITLNAHNTILATGGYGAIFSNRTTNTPASTGDGILAALHVNAQLRDMEFMQFHPTALKTSSLLISEAARGAGATLIDENGERFVDELATRDHVAAAIMKHLNEGHEVFLDMRSLPESVLNQTLKHEVKQARIIENVDPQKEPVPIAPAAHYSMGGIAVTPEGKVLHVDNTSFDNLFAIGECACSGVHGANRLGGNSLLEIIHTGRLAVQHANHTLKHATASSTHDLEANLQRLRTNPETDHYPLRDALSQLLFNHGFIFKSYDSLQHALKELHMLKERASTYGAGDENPAYNDALFDLLDLHSSLEIAEIYLYQSLNRCESRGAHRREDYPETLEKAEHSYYSQSNS